MLSLIFLPVPGDPMPAAAGFLVILEKLLMRDFGTIGMMKKMKKPYFLQKIVTAVCGKLLIIE